MILDVRGKNCPIPLLRTRHHIKNMSSGELIQVLSTDYGTIQDMQDFCNTHGHILQSITEKKCTEYDTVYALIVVKGQSEH